MGQKLVVGPINKGLINNRLPFNIDNDSFPILINAYQWRGRVKRKRGTEFLTRFMRFFNSLISSYNPGLTTFNLTAGAGNILTGFTTLQADASVVPGSVTINDVTSGNTYTDPNSDGILVGAPAGSGTINYATGAITIAGGGNDTINANFDYYPTLPVMGLEEDATTTADFSGTLGFDTTYSYNILTAFPYLSYDVSFYKNPASTGAYVQKALWTPVTWNGQNYQQFWSTNYQGALWVTNGITVPFTITNIGMQFKSITTVTVISSGPPAIVSLNITAHGLVVGDFVFINEVMTTTGINFQTGFVTTVTDANNVIVQFPAATINTNGAGGIAQYLTNRSDTTVDCIRYYDGDPTTGTPLSPGFSPGLGWVNFTPPISQLANTIADLPAAIYYLVGARMIIPFKDRLCFIGPVVQTSGGFKAYLQDTVIYSQNGTPYYTGSYTSLNNDPRIATVTPALIVPVNQTASPAAYFDDSTGFGGNVVVGIDQPINTAYSNQDVIIMGMRNTQVKMVYTGTDLVPFNFYIINSELGSSSTFSGVIMDEGVLTRGDRGFVMSNQVAAQRFDLDIPDEVFQMALTNNGTERVCGQRDYINEWIYFTYPNDSDAYVFPNQTLQYNYRDQSWAVNLESYTTYGQFKRQTGFTWATVGLIYSSWNVWNDPWDAGESDLIQPQVIAGNTQGFVLIRGIGTGEGKSLAIKSISGATITSPNHGLNDGDFIIINGVLGTVSYEVNGFIFQVNTVTANDFMIDTPTSGTYIGGGTIIRIYTPFIQTKQFPLAWDTGRKTRIGAQQYLLTTTSNSQITLLIYLSQNASSPYNSGTIVPDLGSINDGLIYSSVLYTCPESTNLGLTPANINLQTPTALSQSQIWHRINTSLIGDTVQLGFTVSDDQTRDLELSGETFAITGATQANPCVLMCTSNGLLPNGGLVLISGVVGMTQLNGNTYNVLSSTDTTVTIGVDSTGFTPYVSGGIISLEYYVNLFAEIELHGFILDVSPSQVLV